MRISVLPVLKALSMGRIRRVSVCRKEVRAVERWQGHHKDKGMPRALSGLPEGDLEEVKCASTCM